MSITQNTTVTADGLDRLLEQYKGKPRMTALVSAWLDECQAVEDALWSIYYQRELQNDVAADDLLDKIGKIVGQLRGSLDDATYRAYIRARIRANRSGGTLPDIYKVFSLLFGSDTGMLYTPGGTASFEFRILDALTPDQAAAGVSFLTESKAAGVRAIFEWQEQPDNETFTFSFGTYATTDTSVTDTVLPVVSTAGFPASGNLLIDAGLGAEEIVTYTILNSTNFTVSAMASAHDIGAAVSVDGESTIGFTGGTYVDSAASSGGGSLVCISTGGFNASGSILIDQGLSTEETIAYTSISGTTFTLVGTLVYSHAVGAAVIDPASTIGGALAQAAEA